MALEETASFKPKFRVVEINGFRKQTSYNKLEAVALLVSCWWPWMVTIFMTCVAISCVAPGTEGTAINVEWETQSLNAYLQLSLVFWKHWEWNQAWDNPSTRPAHLLHSHPLSPASHKTAPKVVLWVIISEITGNKLLLWPQLPQTGNFLNMIKKKNGKDNNTYLTETIVMNSQEESEYSQT